MLHETKSMVSRCRERHCTMSWVHQTTSHDVVRRGLGSSVTTLSRLLNHVARRRAMSHNVARCRHRGGWVCISSTTSCDVVLSLDDAEKGRFHIVHDIVRRGSKPGHCRFRSGFTSWTNDIVRHGFPSPQHRTSYFTMSWDLGHEIVHCRASCLRNWLVHSCRCAVCGPCTPRVARSAVPRAPREVSARSCTA